MLGHFHRDHDEIDLVAARQLGRVAERQRYAVLTGRGGGPLGGAPDQTAKLIAGKCSQRRRVGPRGEASARA